jgi:transcriptional regulator with XRE-family HTH domain
MKKLKMLNDPDIKSIDNIIKKLQIYMQRNNQTMHGLASLMGFDYQPFYRLMTKKSLPTISSLNHIAQKLNCSVSELIADNIFLDIHSFNNIETYLTHKPTAFIRIYVTEDLLQDIGEFIAIKTDLPNIKHCVNKIDYQMSINIYQLFIATKKINIDGFFLVKYKKQIIMLEVVSISSKVIIATYEGKIIQIPIEELEAFAKFITFIELPSMSTNAISGKFI